LSAAKVIVGIVATRDGTKWVMGAEPLIEVAASWLHTFPVEIAFTTPKDVNIKLSLKGTEVINLQVVVSINGEPSHIAKDELDVAREFCMVKRVTKSLIMQKF